MLFKKSPERVYSKSRGLLCPSNFSSQYAGCVLVWRHPELLWSESRSHHIDQSVSRWYWSTDPFRVQVFPQSCKTTALPSCTLVFPFKISKTDANRPNRSFIAHTCTNGMDASSFCFGCCWWPSLNTSPIQGGGDCFLDSEIKIWRFVIYVGSAFVKSVSFMVGIGRDFHICMCSFLNHICMCKCIYMCVFTCMYAYFWQHWL